MKIKKYEDSYRQKIIVMVSEARRALGIDPTVREDLYDIQFNYLDKGDMFWVAVDNADGVIGCLGCSRIQNTNEAFLHRFYVSASLKRQGIGTSLLKNAQSYMREQGIRICRVHLGGDPETWFESYSFYHKHGFVPYAPRYMMKEL